MPRLYREAPLNSIWEGSGNINALDVLRVLDKHPESIDAWRAELLPAFIDGRIARAARELETELLDHATREVRARFIVERMALVWQAALLVQHAPSFVSDAFIASRVDGASTQTLGTLPADTALREIVDRAALS